MRICSIDYLQKIHTLAKENEILLIFDEVAVGFGRLETCLLRPNQVASQILSVFPRLNGWIFADGNNGLYRRNL